MNLCIINFVFDRVRCPTSVHVNMTTWHSSVLEVCTTTSLHNIHYTYNTCEMGMLRVSREQVKILCSVRYATVYSFDE